MSEVSKELKKLGKTWQKTEAKQGGGGSRIEDGEYILKLLSMEVTKSKKGRLQVAIKYKIRKPKEAKGKETMTFHGLENENNIAYFKGLAEVIGLELPDDMEDLPDALESFVDECEDDLTVKFKTNQKGYQNMTILAVGDNAVEQSDGKEEEEGEEEEEDDKKKKKKKKDGEEEEEEEGEEEEEDDKKKKKKKKKKEDEDD